MESSSPVNGRAQFRTRFLTDPDNVFQHNAWDNVTWNDEQELAAKAKVVENSSIILSEENQLKFETDAKDYWDAFYNQHQNRFFKDRHWLFTEFPELIPKECRDKFENNGKEDGCGDHMVSSTKCVDDGDYPGANCQFKVFEIGCGVGNTVFPILQSTAKDQVFVYCCDFSQTAVNIVQESTCYDPERCYVFTCDVTADDWKAPFPQNSLDVISIIFVLSAIHPEKLCESDCLKMVVKFLIEVEVGDDRSVQTTTIVAESGCMWVTPQSSITAAATAIASPSLPPSPPVPLISPLSSDTEDLLDEILSETVNCSCPICCMIHGEDWDADISEDALLEEDYGRGIPRDHLEELKKFDKNKEK